MRQKHKLYILYEINHFKKFLSNLDNWKLHAEDSAAYFLVPKVKTYCLQIGSGYQHKVKIQPTTKLNNGNIVAIVGMFAVITFDSECLKYSDYGHRWK